MVLTTTQHLTVTCGSQAHVLAADWYRPSDEPLAGFVWLQHGFSRSKRHLASLARSLAAATGAAIVVPTISSRFVSRSGCWINGSAMHLAVAHLLLDRFDALEASAEAAGVGPLPSRFVLAGHSAGGNLAAAAAGLLTQIDAGGGPGLDGLCGVVMLDGVDHRGAIGLALDRLSGASHRPVWTIAAPDSRCNASGSGTAALRVKRPDQFVGVRLTTGSHVDAEGPDSGRLAGLVCGTPTAANVDAVRTITADWIGALLADRPETALFADPSASFPALGTPVTRLPG
jgi:alpha/beta hydrolase fold